MDARADLDPELAEALAASPLSSVDLGELLAVGANEVRDAFASASWPPLPPETTLPDERVVPGRDGDPDVLLRIYRPPAASVLPCIYWIHGGGFVLPAGPTEPVRLRRWSDELPCVVVSVDYRLAPEHPYPAPLEDCYTGLLWTANHADELGVDPGRLVVAGASAGGGLAAGLVLLARDRGEVPIAYQLLIYPMIDDRHITPSSSLDTVVWSTTANLHGWRAYLGALHGTDDVPVYAAPARATDLAGLPAAFVGVGTLDLFRDEDIAYAMSLLAAGVQTELHVYPGAPHGFEVMPSDVGRRAQRDIDDALARALRG